MDKATHTIPLEEAACPAAPSVAFVAVTNGYAVASVGAIGIRRGVDRMVPLERNCRGDIP
jgi:hypothetical protein